MGLQGLISRCGSSRRGFRFRSSAAVESMSKEEVEKSSQWRSQRSYARTGKACESRGGTLDCQASNSVLSQEQEQGGNFRDGAERCSRTGRCPALARTHPIRECSGLPPRKRRSATPTFVMMQVPVLQRAGRRRATTRTNLAASQDTLATSPKRRTCAGCWDNLPIADGILRGGIPLQMLPVESCKELRIW